MNGEWNPSSLAQDSGHGNAQHVRRVTAYGVGFNPAGARRRRPADRANWTNWRQFTHREEASRMDRFFFDESKDGLVKSLFEQVAM